VMTKAPTSNALWQSCISIWKHGQLPDFFEWAS
jgi:hypothetical protein